VIGGLVLAAGAGRRFGEAKQLAEFEGRPLLEHALLAMTNAPSVGTVTVVLGAHAQTVLAGLALHGAEVILCPEWKEGQSAALRAGVRALSPRAEAIVITLGDQPLIAPEAIERTLSARDRHAAALRATYSGVPGHPVLIERSLFEPIASLRGDTGAQALFAGRAVHEVPCDGLGRPDDIDTPEQLETLSAARSDVRQR
jgi:CTP:molybdopterin cytidylyltransferase MocA